MTLDSEAPGDLPDFELLRVGDRDAMRALIRRHEGAVYRVAYSVMANRADAEDVAQETWQLFWEKRASIRIVGESVLPWLITTARLVGLNRRRRRRRASGVPLADDEAPGGGQTLEEIFMATEMTRSLVAVIRQLSDLDRDILALCLLEHLSYKQAAARLRISHAAVRNRLARARATVRAQVARNVGGTK